MMTDTDKLVLPENEDRQRRARILHTALALYQQHGIWRVSMNQVAAACGISKKTVYKYFNSTALVKEAVSGILIKYTKGITLLRKMKLNPQDEILVLFKIVASVPKDFSFLFIEDLKRYFPEIWSGVEDFKVNILSEALENNIARGVKEGIYMSTIDQQLVYKMFFNMLVANVEYRSFSGNGSGRSASSKIVQYLLFGILDQRKIARSKEAA